MINIDSTAYNIPIMTGYKIKADSLYKYAERTEDGILHSELIGFYFNYSGVQMGTITDSSLYHDLWLKLTEPVESHWVTMYEDTGEYTFQCYFANINSAIKTVQSGVPVWTGLTFDIIAISPARTP